MVKLYAHVSKTAAQVLLNRGRDQWPKKWEDFIKEVQDILQDQRLFSGTVLTGKTTKDPDAMDVDAVKGKKSLGQSTKSTKVQKLAMTMEEAKRRRVCAGCGSKDHLVKNCDNSGSLASSSKKGEFSTSCNSKFSSKDKGKGKEQGKDGGKQSYTKKSIREVYGSDSDRFEELSESEMSSSSSDEEVPKPKKKSSSKAKTQQANRVVLSDDEDFLVGPM